MSDKSIAQRLALKPGQSLLLVNAPAGYAATIGELPPGATLVEVGAGSPRPTGPVDAIQVFFANRREMEEGGGATPPLRDMKAMLAPRGMLWVTYHKGTSRVKTDINRDSIAAYAQTIGLQAVAMIAIDDDWAALRLKIV